MMLAPRVQANWSLLSRPKDVQHVIQAEKRNGSSGICVQVEWISTTYGVMDIWFDVKR